MGERITITTSAGSFGAYLARPAAASTSSAPSASSASSAPAIAVMQEIFGINKDMRETCDWLAEHGFIAACPDLFWRLEPGVEMSDGSEAEWKKGFALYQAFNVDTGVEDAAATMQHLRELPGCNGKVGITGFCLGGLLTFLTTARQRSDASVAYYGGATEGYVEEGRDIATPLLMHLAGSDEYMPAEAQQLIRDTLAGNPQITIHTYPGQSHAFARRGGQHYDAASATLANDRTIAFFREHLGGA
jgi:carboxymethylenebutenolidase